MVECAINAGHGWWLVLLAVYGWWRFMVTFGMTTFAVCSSGEMTLNNVLKRTVKATIAFNLLSGITSRHTFSL